jgi:CHASE3 domain sensor protein
MKSLAVRLTLLGLLVVAIGVAAYVVWAGQSRAQIDRNAARAFDAAALDAARVVLEMRAAQQAYVAAGQGEEFWTSKVAAAATALQDTLTALRRQAASPEAQSSIDNASSALQDFEQLDRRARDYARTGQKLLASDVIFADGFEITRAIAASLEQARSAELQSGDSSAAALRRRQFVAAGAAAFVALFAVALLVPRPDAPEAPLVTPLETSPASDYRLTDTPNDKSSSEHEKGSGGTAAVTPAIDLAAVASLCSDLALVVDTQALPALLARAAAMLDAQGAVLWIADPDGRELSPIITHGYPAQLVSRLGTILRDAENVTASAFRTSLLQTVAADAVSNGAIAAPLVTPAGCVGVMAAEMRNEGEQDSAKLAAAAIIAAQLATLVGPPSTRAQAKPEVASSV